MQTQNPKSESTPPIRAKVMLVTFGGDGRVCGSFEHPINLATQNIHGLASIAAAKLHRKIVELGSNVGPLTTRNDPALEQARDMYSRAITIRAATLDDANRSVEAVLSTDQPVTVMDWNRYEPIDEVLLADGGDYPTQMPLLECHARYSLDNVLGSIRDIRRDGNSWVGRLYFAKDDARADMAWNKVRGGHLTDVSIGYRSTKYVDIPAGQSGVVNGKNYSASSERALRVTTAYSSKEGSLVPIGADSKAKVRGADVSAPLHNEAGNARKETPMYRKYLESLGLRANATDAEMQAFAAKLSATQRQRADAISATIPTMTLEDALRAELLEQRASGGTTPVTAPVTQPVAEGQRQAPGTALTEDQIRAAERTRGTTIRSLAGAEAPSELVERAINEGWSVERASTAILEHIRGRREGSVGGDAPGGIVRDKERELTRATLGVAMVIRSGASDQVIQAVVRRAGIADKWENVAQRADRYRDMSMLDVAREAIRLDGREVPASRDETVRAAVSGGSLSAIFTTSVNARVMAGWDQAPDTTSAFVEEDDVADFKQQDEIDYQVNAQLKRVPRGGTADDADSSDTKETWRVYRYGKKVSVDEQDITDDNFGVLITQPFYLGENARFVRPDLVYALLLSNPTLNADAIAVFHASHANLGTGAGSALSKDALQAGITAMSKQTKGTPPRPLNIKAQYLLLPQDIAWTGKELVSSAQILKSTGSDKTIEFGRNVLVDENLSVISEGRLGITGVIDPVTGKKYVGTATNWWLASRAGRTVKVGYLRGTGRAPMVRPYVLDKGQWGLGWDVKLDIGAVIKDYRGFYKSNGV